MEQAILPYGGTSGFSGSSTSAERAKLEDSTGITSQRQQMVLDFLSICGSRGATYRDLCDTFGWHHGQASGVLSVLHKTEKIDRLKLVRNRCKIYCLPEFVGERETELHKSNAEDTDPTLKVRLTRHMAEVLINIDDRIWWDNNNLNLEQVLAIQTTIRTIERALATQK